MDIKINSSTVIVFDLDDTLYNEIEYLKSAYKEIAIKLESDDWMPLYARIFSLYRSNENVFEFLSKTYEISIKDLIDLYRNHKPNISLFDNVLTIIKQIKAKKGKVCIITDGRKTTQLNKITSLNLSNVINEVVISEEIGTEKPCQENYLAIEKKFKDCNYYYIADNLKKDFIAPNKLGWSTIALLDNGLNIHSNSHLFTEEKYMPQKFISSYNEVNIV